MLPDIQLRNYYRSDRNNLLRDFYIPCIKESVKYDRAVGYFSSWTLSAAASGLEPFIASGGEMRLVASPFLTREDAAAIETGYAQREEIIAKALVRGLRIPAPDPVNERIGYLAWLISEDRLSIKIALVERSDKVGIYHEKIGVFADEKKNAVAFTGSANESIGGLIANFESVEVYRSWRESDSERVAQKMEDFTALWEEKTPMLQVFDFPEAARRELLNFRPTVQPGKSAKVDDIDGFVLDTACLEALLAPVVETKRHYLKIDLKERQSRARHRWNDAAQRGIFAMATGTGKTITALGCAIDVPDLQMVIVSVPTSELVSQWCNEIATRTSLRAPIVIGGDSSTWMEPLFTKLKLLHRNKIANDKLPVVLVGTYSELSKKRFSELIADAGGLPEATMLIADEVHNVGAGTFRNIMREDIRYRLGLSATPVRPHDEEGTEHVLDYFGGVVFEFGLKDAIDAGILCEYDYHVCPVLLDHEEYKEFKVLSARIASNRESGTGHADFWSIKRGEILKSASAKIPRLKSITKEHDLRRGMIYCADIEHATEAAGLLATAGLRVARYSSDDHDRKQLLTSFAKNEIECLVAVKCLDEGVDVPSCSVGVILASDTSERQFVQRRGRILRWAPKKQVAKLIDVLVLPPVEDKITPPIQSEIDRIIAISKAARNRMSLVNSLARELAPYGITHSDLF